VTRHLFFLKSAAALLKGDKRRGCVRLERRKGRLVAGSVTCVVGYGWMAVWRWWCAARPLFIMAPSSLLASEQLAVLARPSYSPRQGWARTRETPTGSTHFSLFNTVRTSLFSLLLFFCSHPLLHSLISVSGVRIMTNF
jgi:hypothetical protein